MKTSSAARHRWIALTLLSAIEFMILLDTSIVNIALPTIQAGLHFSEADLGWVQNIYLLIFGAFLLFAGRAADLFGRRRLFLLGLTLFTLSSLLAGLAPSAAILLLVRALQGLGAAVIIPAEQSLLATVFIDPHEFNRAFGIWSALGAAGGAFGLVLGGVITQFFGWPWVFLINVPVGALVFLASLRFIPESRAEGERKPLGVAGILTMTPALLGLSYGLARAKAQGWPSPATIGVFVLVALLLLAFVGIEARSSAPLVPLRPFRRRDLNGANLVSFLVGASHQPMFYFLSLYLQQVLLYRALTAGLAILPIAGLGVVLAFLGLSKALGKLDFRGVLATGMALLTVGLVLLARAPLPNTYLLDLLPASLLVAPGGLSGYVVLRGSGSGPDPVDHRGEAGHISSATRRAARCVRWCARGACGTFLVFPHTEQRSKQHDTVPVCAVHPYCKRLKKEKNDGVNTNHARNSSP